MKTISSRTIRSLWQGAVLLFLAGAAFSGRSVHAQATLKGSGSTFAYPVYSKWFVDYQKKDPSLNFEYEYSGSSAGIKAVLARTVDFGATDAVLSDAQLKEAQAKHILHLPTFAGAVVVTYNLPGNPALKLDASTIADLFLGKIARWNDERLAKLNPGVSLPDAPVDVVHRSDGSGTTNIFTEYLSKVSPEWKSAVGSGRSVNWPTGKGAKGNRGVVEAVKATPGALAYAEHAATTALGLPDATVQNSSGKFIRADVKSVGHALSAAVIPEDLRFDLTNAPGEEAYPIAGATWLLVHADTKDKARNRKLVQFLAWAMEKGDEVVLRMNCVPLSPDLKKQVVGKLKQLKTP